jgi:hypothetical protein
LYKARPATNKYDDNSKELTPAPQHVCFEGFGLKKTCFKQVSRTVKHEHEKIRKFQEKVVRHLLCPKKVNGQES